MMRDEATSRENHERFVQRVVESEVVWGLRGPHGFAECESDETEGPVLMFWSDRGYASRVRQQEFADHEPVEISLFDFLFRWLPGMSDDDVLAGTNWTGDLVGLEVDPEELQEEIVLALGTDRFAAYKERLADEQKKQSSGH